MLRWAMILAAFAVLTSVAVLVLPIVVTEELSWRASVGSSISTAIATILGAIALMLTAYVESADYKSQQEVKSELAKLHATLSSAQLRAGIELDANRRSNTDFTAEKEALRTFASSVSGFAFYFLAAEKSVRSKKSPQEWRLFHMYLSEMVNTDDVGAFLNRAIRVQRLLTGLTDADLRYLSRSVQDLSKSVSKFDWVIENNVLLNAMHQVYGGQAPQNGKKKTEVDRGRLVTAQFRFLKSKGVNDPDIDMFLAVDANDAAALESALKNGANPNLTDGAVLARHAEALKSFKA